MAVESGVNSLNNSVWGFIESRVKNGVALFQSEEDKQVKWLGEDISIANLNIKELISLRKTGCLISKNGDNPETVIFIDGGEVVAKINQSQLKMKI